MIGEKSWESQSLGFGSGFDLTQGILGQGLDGYAGTSRVGSKVLCVDCVESGKLLPMSEALASGLKKYRLGHLYRSLAVNFSEPTPL